MPPSASAAPLSPAIARAGLRHPDASPSNGSGTRPRREAGARPLRARGVGRRRQYAVHAPSDLPCGRGCPASDPAPGCFAPTCPETCGASARPARWLRVGLFWRPGTRSRGWSSAVGSCDCVPRRYASPIPAQCTAGRRVVPDGASVDSIPAAPPLFPLGCAALRARPFPIPLARWASLTLSAAGPTANVSCFRKLSWPACQNRRSSASALANRASASSPRGPAGSHLDLLVRRVAIVVACSTALIMGRRIPLQARFCEREGKPKLRPSSKDAGLQRPVLLDQHAQRVQRRQRIPSLRAGEDAGLAQHFSVHALQLPLIVHLAMGHRRRVTTQAVPSCLVEAPDRAWLLGSQRPKPGLPLPARFFREGGASALVSRLLCVRAVWAI